MTATPSVLDADMASRLVAIALSHVAREHPNVVASPKHLHPIFYGSYDWHSCVHSYWLLATLYRLFPHLKECDVIRALFDDALTPHKAKGERLYLEPATERGFERPYGWAWFLMLQAELMRHAGPQAQGWGPALEPLVKMFVKRFNDYLPKAIYPIRAGTHGNTAFALALVLEYAQSAKDEELVALVRAKARAWYGTDRDCQAWEPSGEDFLSPALVEAECMRRVLAPRAFKTWFARFLPGLAHKKPSALFEPVRVSDRSDGRIVHLDGLNLSRAWCWRSLAATLSTGDAVHKIAVRTAERHLEASLPHLTGDYMGEHWLASFALLALRVA